MVRFLFCICLLFALLWQGCGKERTNLDWAYRKSGIEGDWSKIVIAPSGLGYMVGGIEWSLGTAARTTDGGMSWSFDSISDKRLYDVYLDEQARAYAVGVDGYLYTKEENAEWEFHRLARWSTNRGVAFQDYEIGLIGSGAAFGNGLLTNFDNIVGTFTHFELDFEISDVCFSDDQTMHAVGYGVVLRTADQGVTWEWADVRDEYFQAIQFVNDRVGYIVGFNGSILKTTDNGSSWTYLRESQKALVKDFPFRDLYFSDEQNGYICGEEGLLWYTRDGGESWTVVEDLPEENFNAVAVFEDRGYLVGEEGVIVEFFLE